MRPAAKRKARFSHNEKADKRMKTGIKKNTALIAITGIVIVMVILILINQEDIHIL